MENMQTTGKDRAPLYGLLFFALTITLAVIFIGTPHKELPKGLISTTQAQADKDLNEVYKSALSTLMGSLPDPGSFEEINHETYYLKGRHEDPSKYMEVVIEYRSRNNEGGMVNSKYFFTYNSAKELMIQGKVD